MSVNLPEGASKENAKCGLEAFCATQQAMEMRAKGMFELTQGASLFRDAAKVCPDFRVIQEGRPTDHVDVAFLHRRVPVKGFFHAETAAPDLTAVAGPMPEGAEESKEHLVRVTRWAPAEITRQFAFLGEGQALGGSSGAAAPMPLLERMPSNSETPSPHRPVLARLISGAEKVKDTCGT